MRKERTHEYLKYRFTDAETLELARELGQENQKMSAAEETKKEVTSEISAQINGHKKEIARLCRLVNQGYDYRTIECAIDYDTPDKGMKRIVRLDTGELVREEKMTDEDRQAQLPLVETAAAGA